MICQVPICGPMFPDHPDKMGPDVPSALKLPASAERSMTADPANATRQRLEQALGQVAAGFGRASALSGRYYARALRLLEQIEHPPRDG